MNKNGYNKSILPTIDGQCYVCKRWTDTARHEVFYGTANRKISKSNGLWIAVCPTCHSRIHERVHQEDGIVLDTILKRAMQLEYEKTHSRDEFMALIGKNYL